MGAYGFIRYVTVTLAMTSIFWGLIGGGVTHESRLPVTHGGSRALQRARVHGSWSASFIGLMLMSK